MVLTMRGAQLMFMIPMPICVIWYCLNVLKAPRDEVRYSLPILSLEIV